MISDCRSPYQENLRPERSVACWLEARGSHQHNSTSDLGHTSMFWEVEIKEGHKEKNTRIIVPSPSFSHTFEGVSEWDLLNMLNQELINCAIVTVYPCLSFPFSTYEHQFVFRRGNMPGRMYLLDHCDFLPWLLSAFQIPRRHYEQAQAANVRPCCVQHCSIDLCFNF